MYYFITKNRKHGPVLVLVLPRVVGVQAVGAVGGDEEAPAVQQ